MAMRENTVTYFPDLFVLSSYSLSGTRVSVVKVGYLDGVHPFPKGSLEPRLVDKIKLLAAKAPALAFGTHVCEICVAPPGVVPKYVFIEGDLKMIDPDCAWWKWRKQRQGNGEIRVAGDGAPFEAPVLIVHYIEEHSYLPPLEFLQAIDKAR
jgi:hypothetical protein